jgi:uncharacterized protein YjiK
MCFPLRSLVLGLAALVLAAGASAQPLPLIREVDDEEAAGAPFPPGEGIQLELGAEGGATLSWARGRRRDLSDASLVAFARAADGSARVVALDPVSGELLVLRAGARGVASQTLRLGELVGLEASGLAFDADNGRLFVLEGSRARIVRMDDVLRARRRSETIELSGPLPVLRGLAFDPASGHLLALAPPTGELLELAQDGRLVSVRMLPEHARGARTLAIAPSTDGSDAPERLSLFAAAPSAGGGTTYELALEPLALAAATTVSPTLLQTVLTSAFTPPSPDPSGIELLGPDGPLLISDGEVEEMSIYRGANLFEVSLAGSLLSTADTTAFSDEPTGVARNPGNGHLFFSDDTGTRSVYEVTPGSDGRVSPGDPVRQIVLPSSIDTEGVAFGSGSLWIADGVNAEVYRISPGGNGLFDGGGDDLISHFDVGALGVTDPEGIAYDPDGGNLYLTGAGDDLVAHVTASGALLRWLDLSAGNPRNSAGLAYGPGPAGTTTRRLYLVARGTDNDSDPNENDGKLFVFAVAPLSSGNQAPSVSAGPDLTTDLSQPVALDGSVGDDGLPNPPGQLTTSWSQLSGPGTITFAQPNAVDTTATFSGVGTYVARLTASDSQLSAFDDVAIVVSSSDGTTTLEKRVAAGSDDAEQGASGAVDLTSSDLELVTDGSDVQAVGVRFAGLAIPRGAPIQAAWLQFQTDEATSVATSLTIRGEASDDAAPFTSGTNNVGARPRTAAAVAWAPPAWNVVGEAGLAQRSPDLRAIVQEIVNRSGWSSGHSLAFVLTGSGSRVAESYDGTASAAPLLHVVFGGSAGNQPPSASAGPDRIVALAEAAALDGSASDDGLPNPPGALTTRWSQVSGPGVARFADANTVDTTVSFSAAGSYVLRLSVSDGEAEAADDAGFTVVDPDAPGVVNARIAAGADDAEQRVSNGSVALGGDDLELGFDRKQAQLIGLRFQNLVIPPGAHIRSAWIQLTADETKTSLASLTIAAEASANAAVLRASAFDLSSRPRTATSVAWTPPVWSLVGESGAAQRTPDLTALVQEVVNRPGWDFGNAMVFLVSGSGTRTAESFEGSAASAPLLHVEYGP